MEADCAAVREFVRRVAVDYVSRGYFFFVCGAIPTRKDPAKTDQKIISHYGINVSKWTRARRRKLGSASVQYLRLNRKFVILATEGEHPFFREEERVLQDVRQTPIKIGRYSIICRHVGPKHYVSVRIEKREFEEIRRRMLARAKTSSAETLVLELRLLYRPRFRGIWKQVVSLAKQVNRIRNGQGLDPVRVDGIVFPIE